MEEYSKSKSSSVPSDQAEPDIMVLIERMQQQLVVLEKKMDILISQSSSRPSEGRHYSKPSERFDRPRSRDRGDQDNRYREKSYSKAICAECNKECDVPFKPTGDRPVYCSDCFEKHNAGNAFKGKYDRGPKREDSSEGRYFDKKQGGESRGFGKKKRPMFRRRKERN